MIIIIPGNPPRKDDYEKIVTGKGGKPHRTLTSAGRKFRRDVRNEVRRLLDKGGAFPDGPLFSVAISMYVVSSRHFDDVSVPRRDIDSSISATLDALQHAGVFGEDKDADMRVEYLYPPKRFKDADNPRIEIEVRTWTTNRS